MSTLSSSLHSTFHHHSPWQRPAKAVKMKPRPQNPRYAHPPSRCTRRGNTSAHTPPPLPLTPRAFLRPFSIRTSASLHPPSYPFYLLSSLPALTSYPSSLPSLASSVPSLINFLPSVSFPLAISFPFFLRSFPQSPSLPPSFLPSLPTSTLLPSFLPSAFFHSAVPSFTQHPSLLTPFSQVSGEAAGIVAQPKQR